VSAGPAVESVDGALPAAIEKGVLQPTPLRWVTVAICFLYGFAKVNKSQFTVLDSEVTRPMGEVSGFWLTWYYFGYSAAYGTLIALAQIAGGVLLAWPRTALIGALVLVPVFANILLVDVFFGIGIGPTVVALIALGCLVAVIAPNASRLRAVLLAQVVDRRPGLRVLALLLMLGSAGGFTWWVANYNNISPTEIDGTWAVVPNQSSTSPWRQVFFERNRAFWVTFRSADGKDEIHHFEVDDAGIVRVWQTWLRKGELLMEGRVSRDGRLQLHPIDTPADPLLLERIARPRP
jgi:hypothetical protein